MPKARLVYGRQAAVPRPTTHSSANDAMTCHWTGPGAVPWRKNRPPIPISCSRLRRAATTSAPANTPVPRTNSDTATTNAGTFNAGVTPAPAAVQPSAAVAHDAPQQAGRRPGAGQHPSEAAAAGAPPAADGDDEIGNLAVQAGRRFDDDVEALAGDQSRQAGDDERVLGQV